MKKEEINKIISMLDEDVIADGLECAEIAPRSINKRKFMTALIAAALAVVLLAGAAVAAFRRPAGDVKNILPPENATVIKMSSSKQFTADTVYTSGNYYTAETVYNENAGESYASVGSLEFAGDLYDSLVQSNDGDRVWAIELSVSPNLYMTKEYIEKEAAYWLAQYELKDLSSIEDVYDQIKENFDIKALYEQFKDKFKLEELYKYFASGQLEKDILAADLDALKAQAEKIWEECVSIQDGFWSELSIQACKALEDLGITYEEKDGKITIYVTEEELLSLDLDVLAGLKFSKADEYDIDLDKFDRFKEWGDKHVSEKLDEVLGEYEGEDVLYAVIPELSVFAEMIDRGNYEEAYKALFAELAKRPELKKALEDAAAGAEKYAEAVKQYGEEILGKYFTEEGFNKEQFDADTAELTKKMNEMRENLYESADKIYAEFSELVRYIEVKEDGTVVIYVTAEELAALETIKEYTYKLAN